MAKHYLGGSTIIRGGRWQTRDECKPPVTEVVTVEVIEEVTRDKKRSSNAKSIRRLIKENFGTHSGSVKVGKKKRKSPINSPDFIDNKNSAITINESSGSKPEKKEMSHIHLTRTEVEVIYKKHPSTKDRKNTNQKRRILTVSSKKK